MKRRIAPRLLLLLGGTFFTSTPHKHNGGSVVVVDATLLDDYNLRIRPDITDLTHLSHSRYAPRIGNIEEDVHDEGGQQLHRHLQPKYGRCTSPLTDWTRAHIRKMSYKTYRTLVENKITSLAYVYKHYVDTSHSDEYFVNNIQTAELTKRHADTINFWKRADIDNSIMADDILLLSMHGSDLADTAKLVPTIMRMFDFTDMNDILAYATKVQDIVKALPGGYDNPLLTMNAVATRSTYSHGSYGGHEKANGEFDKRIKDSIILGDGVLQFLYDSGLEASGPDFVHAHVSYLLLLLLCCWFGSDIVWFKRRVIWHI